jgi:hypothetical protein
MRSRSVTQHHTGTIRDVNKYPWNLESGILQIPRLYLLKVVSKASTRMLARIFHSSFFSLPVVLLQLFE